MSRDAARRRGPVRIDGGGGAQQRFVAPDRRDRRAEVRQRRAGGFAQVLVVAIEPGEIELQQLRRVGAGREQRLQRARPALRVGVVAQQHDLARLVDHHVGRTGAAQQQHGGDAGDERRRLRRRALDREARGRRAAQHGGVAHLDAPIGDRTDRPHRDDVRFLDAQVQRPRPLRKRMLRTRHGRESGEQQQ